MAGRAHSSDFSNRVHEISEDVHICGACKLQFNSVKTFLLHKKQNSCVLRRISGSPQEDVFDPSFVHGGKDASTTDDQDDQQDDVGSTGIVEACDGQSPTEDPFQEPCLESANIDSTIKSAKVPGKTICKNQKRFQCEVNGCNYTSVYQKDLLRHIRTHTGERPFVCADCGKTFNRADKLRIHERYHSGNKPYKCSECDYATSDSSSLKKHMRIHSNERPFKCQICPYASRNSSQLVVHLRTHTGDSPFHCSICTFKFKINSDLKRHMRLHTGEKPFACDHCSYRCAVKANLKTHIRLNHDSCNLQKCDHCEFTTASRKLMKEHEKIHSTKAIQCKQCPYSTNSRTAMKNHVRIHSNVRPFKCELCSYASRQAGNVRTHTKKRHPEKLYRTKKSSKKESQNLAAAENGCAVGASGRNVKGRPLCEQWFQCNVCEAAFVREDSLRSHQRQHQDRFRQLEGAAMAVLQLSSTGNDPSLTTAPANIPLERVSDQNPEQPSTIPNLMDEFSTDAGLLQTVNTFVSSNGLPSGIISTSSGYPTQNCGPVTLRVNNNPTQADMAAALSTNGSFTSHVQQQQRVIEQILRQSGIFESHGVGLEQSVPATTQVVACVQSDNGLNDGSFLASLNLKSTNPQLLPQTTVAQLMESLNAGNVLTTVNATSQQLGQQNHEASQHQQPQLIYQIQPGLNLNILPLLSLGSGHLSSDHVSSHNGLTEGASSVTPNIQYIINSSHDLILNQGPQSLGTSVMLAQKAEHGDVLITDECLPKNLFELSAADHKQ